MISTWSLARRAAELVVLPVLDAGGAQISLARQLGVGGVLLLGSVPPPAALRAELAPLHAAGSPGVLVMADEEGGGVERLAPDVESIPWARTMAATLTPAAVEVLARSLGHQMASLGVDVDLAPVLDVDGGAVLSATDPDGPRSFSADPAVAGAYGVAFETGLAEAGVLAVLKHFPGLGGATANTDYGPAATLPIATLERAGLLPFEQAFAAGARAVMVANATVPGLSRRPASLSAAVITGLLRGELHFGGLIITDSLSAGAITAAGYSVATAAVAAIAAGADMVLFGSTLTPADTAALAAGPLGGTAQAVIDALVSAVRSGAIPGSRLDQAVGAVAAAEGLDLCSGGAGR